MSKSFSFTRKLTESGVMLALTIVLSYVKLIDLPYGGSITLCSMLPMILIAYRHGMVWGFITGLANGILQLLMGLNNLSYATSAIAAISIIMLDYLLAFSASGLGGMFRKVFKNQTTALVSGAVTVCVIRYLFHVIAGFTVWAAFAPDMSAVVYSLVYNATYMLPELLIVVAGAAYLSGVINFGGDTLVRVAKKEKDRSAFVFKNLGYAAALVAFVADVVLIAPKLQNPESGDFYIKGLWNVNYTAVGVITAVGIILMVAFLVISNIKAKNK